MNLGERIRHAAQLAGGQKALCELTKLSTRTMSDYVAGKVSPQVDTVEKIAKAAGVDLVWLLTGRGGEMPPGFSDSGGLSGGGMDSVSLPRFDIQASAGAGALVVADRPDGFLAVDRDWLYRYVSRSAQIGVIEASGDSMHPTIKNRDLLLVEARDGATREELARGGIFVLTLDGALVVKRLVMQGDALLVISDNAERYPTERIAADSVEHRVKIQGIVFWAGGALETHR